MSTTLDQDETRQRRRALRTGCAMGTLGAGCILILSSLALWLWLGSPLEVLCYIIVMAALFAAWALAVAALEVRGLL